MSTGTYTPIDLSRLPPPQVVEALDYERILAERKAYMVSLWPADQQAEIAATLELESEPLNKLLQENAYRELLWRKRVNEAALATMLAFAEREDLDHAAAAVDVERLVITPATGNSPAVMEGDDSLRERAQMAWEGLSTAGSTSAYIFHARSASGQVADASVHSPAGAEVELTIQSSLGDGTADAELLVQVEQYLSDENRRPVGDRLTVQSVEVLPYSITAVLHMATAGPEAVAARVAAEAALVAVINPRKRIGVRISDSLLKAALHVEGVSWVELVGWNDIVPTHAQAAYCTGYSIEVRT